MNIDDIFTEWEKDCKIDKTDLLVEAVKIPELHHKYLKMLYKENEALHNMDKLKKEATRIKTDYYKGNLSAEELNEYGWKPFNIKLLREELNNYLESDEDIIKVNLKYNLQKEKVQVLNQIINSINNRNFVIKNSLDWLRFTQGN